MLKISRFTVENLREHCVTDVSKPRFSFSLESDRQGTSLGEAEIKVGNWSVKTKSQIAIPYEGAKLKPFTTYEASVKATSNNGETAQSSLTFSTGRMGTAWQGSWISDAGYTFTEKKVSPIPMLFRKRLSLKDAPKSAKLYATALGIYEVTLDGKKVGNRYFAPGFTSYKSQLQYQVYDVTDMLKPDSELLVTVAGGWAVGSFVFTRINRHDADRQALLMELRVTYKDGSEEIIGTDESWDVTEDGPTRMADIYDGETYDATVDISKIAWRKAAKETIRISPKLIADYGAPVTAHEEFKPLSCNKVKNALIYDFGQNFAGVVRINVNGKRGQVITVRHAEILNPDGTLNTAFLRTAKATATYTCVDGKQTYSPRLTYMGFRYISVEGAAESDIEVTGVALYSDMERTGSFECSDKLLNRLQENISWSSKSNLMDIPTDCPQRDERMGWTGDIAVFAPTACYNFDMSRFLDKWLLDVKSEQTKGGGIPNTVPVQGYGFPATMPEMAVAWWGDACILVPWAEYMARGDAEVLRRMYPTMKKYVKACKFWCGFGFGKNRYIWNMPGVLGFGDWVAPDVPQMSQWQARIKWTGTASLRNTSAIVSKVAELLGEKEDAEYYKDMSDKTADAYCSVLTDGNGKLLSEFQTAYVLPIYLDMFPDKETKNKAVDNLVKLVEKSNYCIGTGFPGTPYILFALADNGRADVAFKMLMNRKCPSWLYEVVSGGTTIWERWDGLDENGVCPISDDGTDMMISYNHYSSGAVGAFMYERIAGIEALDAGYRRFRIKPVLGGGLTSAKGSVMTPYGKIVSDWKIKDSSFVINVEVPVSTLCELTLPDGTSKKIGSGVYTESCRLKSV